MKGEAQPLIRYFDGGDKRFIIPLYQRNYDWKEDNCKQLFNDLLDLHKTGRTSHFFGSIVSSIENGTEDRYIIDGQQRITTVSLLLTAFVNAFKAGQIKADDAKLKEKIFRRYLVDEFNESERKVKLKPIKKDMEAFDALLYCPEDKYIKESNVTRNYLYLYERVIKSGLSLDELFESVKKLVVINIKLEADDDAQLIFESLNSTGLDLSEADKIRNYLLMSLSPEEQDSLYTRFWNPIEECTQYDPTPFVRDYLTMKQGKIGRIDKIYYIFKEYTESNAIQRASILEDMCRYAKIYKQIVTANLGNEKIDRKLQQLRILDSTVTYPFLMPFFDYALHNELAIDEQYAVLNVVEAYCARRIICNIPSNAMNKVFATLHREVINRIQKAVPEENATYKDVFIFLLLAKSQTSAFPRDNEVKSEFAVRQVYKIPGNARTFILERMENQDNNERHDIVSLLNNKAVTIEHIMPQTLSAKWKESLGDDWERIHQQYLHTMANITLTGYNSQYSNLTFTEKKEMDKGFKDSAYRLNISVKCYDKWTEEELLKRQQALLDIFMKLWPMPTTKYVPVEKQAEAAALDEEDYEFTGKKIQAYVFNGMRYSVNTWKEMLLQICNHCLVEHKATIEWLCANDKAFLHKQFENGRKQFADGMYVWSDNSTASKIAILKSIMTECGIPHSELVFEFRNDSDDLSSEE